MKNYIRICEIVLSFKFRMRRIINSIEKLFENNIEFKCFSHFGCQIKRFNHFQCQISYLTGVEYPFSVFVI